MVPEARWFAGRVELWMHEELEKISPEQNLVHPSIEASAAPDRRQNVGHLKLKLLLLRQIKEPSTRLNHPRHQTLRHTVIDQLATHQHQYTYMMHLPSHTKH